MFAQEYRELFVQVITSWQVLVITGALLLYMTLVSYVARIYHRPGSVSKSRPKKSKVKAAQTVKSAVKEVADQDNPNAALGLEEA